MTGTLHWINCPFCAEVADLHRLGPVGVIVKGKKQDHMKVLVSKRVKCGFCGKIFRTESNTLWEAFGKDSIGDTPY